MTSHKEGERVKIRYFLTTGPKDMGDIIYNWSLEGSFLLYNLNMFLSNWCIPL